MSIIIYIYKSEILTIDHDYLIDIKNNKLK
jgi:hypothetical protein